jgi:hypothetical protein
MREVTMVLLPTPSAKPASVHAVNSGNNNVPSPTSKMRTSLLMTLSKEDVINLILLL